MRLFCIVLVAALSGACSGNAMGASQADVAKFVGTWAQAEAVQGRTYTISLTAQDSKLTGNGTFSQEGGGTGTFSITGSVSAATLRLDFKFGNGEAAQFSGQLVGDTKLSGSIHPGPADALTPAYIVTFDKK